MPVLPQLLALEFTGQTGPLALFYATILVSIVASQEAHRQAHMNRPAAWVARLQNAGVLVSQKMHAKHHRGAHASSYCILAGACNPILDRIGFFRVVEGLVFRFVGVEPICWGADPDLKDEALRKLPTWLRWDQSFI